MKQVKIMLNGEEIGVTPMTYHTHSYSEMKYYHRKGSRYYFKNKIGLKLIITCSDDLHKYLKYGQVIDLDFN